MGELGNTLAEHELLVRLAVFAGLLVLFVVLESVFPRRGRVLPWLRRAFTNLTMMATGAGLLRVMALAAVPLTAVYAATWAEASERGLLFFVDLPAALEVVIALLLLDVAIWFQHWASHRIGFLWRLHRVHHADRDIDTTTAIRFHPIEIGLSMLFKMAVVVALGAPAFVVIVFEVGLNGFALFNHANLKVPFILEKPLRWLVITPDLHRIHHSVRPVEHNSNFGFSISLWDRVFRTFCSEPKDGQQGMTIGLSQFSTDEPSQIGWSLLLPFSNQATQAAQAAEAAE